MIYWNDRPATLRECTNEFLSFLSKLKELHPAFFGVWYGTGRSKKEALSKKIVLEYPCIKEIFSDSKKDHDDDYPEFTYLGIVWNGKDDYESMELKSSLGGTPSEYLLNLNNCFITLPSEGPVYTYYQEPTHQLSLIKLMIDHWKADFIRINVITKEVLPPFTDEKLLQAIKESVVYYESSVG